MATLAAAMRSLPAVHVALDSPSRLIASSSLQAGCVHLWDVRLGPAALAQPPAQLHTNLSWSRAESERKENKRAKQTVDFNVPKLPNVSKALGKRAQFAQYRTFVNDLKECAAQAYREEVTYSPPPDGDEDANTQAGNSGFVFTSIIIHSNAPKEM